MKSIGNGQDQQLNIAVTVTGLKHERKGVCNQDAFFNTTYEWNHHTYNLMAVSDGHGSDKHALSHIGSQLAVELAATTFTDKMQRDYHENQETYAAYEDFMLNTFLVEWFDNLHRAWQDKTKRHYNRSGLSGDYQSALYGCTLLFAAETPRGVCLVQLGDGKIVLGLPNGDYWLPIAENDRQVFDQTDSMSDWLAPLWLNAVFIAKEEFAFVALSTDGLENAFPNEATDFIDVYKGLKPAVTPQDLEVIARQATLYSKDDVTIGLMGRLTETFETSALRVESLPYPLLKEGWQTPMAPRVLDDMILLSLTLKEASQKGVFYQPLGLNQIYWDETQIRFLQGSETSQLKETIEAYYLAKCQTLLKLTLPFNKMSHGMKELADKAMRQTSIQSFTRALMAMRSQLVIDYDRGRWDIETTKVQNLMWSGQSMSMSLFEDSVIYEAHLGFKYSRALTRVGHVVVHPKYKIWGLKNDTSRSWLVYNKGNLTPRIIGPNETIELAKPKTLVIMGVPIQIHLSDDLKTESKKN